MKRVLLAAFLLVFLAISGLAQTNTGSLRGRVVDSLGAVVVGAEITVVGAGGAQRRAQTNQAGEFSLTLAAGSYTVHVASAGFALYENAEVRVTAGRAAALDVTLSVAETQAEVNIGSEQNVNTDPENNASALVLK